MDEGLDFSAWNTPYEPIAFAPLSGHTLGGPVIGESVEEPAPAEPQGFLSKWSIPAMGARFIDQFHEDKANPLLTTREKLYQLASGLSEPAWRDHGDFVAERKKNSQTSPYGVGGYHQDTGYDLGQKYAEENVPMWRLAPLGRAWQQYDEFTDWGRSPSSYPDGTWDISLPFGISASIPNPLAPFNQARMDARENIIGAERGYEDKIAETQANVLQQMVPIVPPKPQERRDDRQASASDLRRIEEQSRQREAQRQAEASARSAREAAEAQARQRAQEREGARLMAEARANAIQKQREEEARLEQLNQQMLERMRTQEAARKFREREMQGQYGFF